MSINPILLVVLSLIVCSLIGTVANLCTERVKSNCLTIAGLVNLVISVAVIAVIATSLSNARGRGYYY